MYAVATPMGVCLKFYDSRLRELSIAITGRTPGKFFMYQAEIYQSKSDNVVLHSVEFSTEQEFNNLLSDFLKGII